MASVFVPVAYVIIVFGGLFIFSYFYRKHTSTRVYEPYFPSHPERNAYVTLLQMTDPPASDALLKSALVRRAMADVQRVLRIREDKPALQNLLQKGSVGDDLWNSLLAAEKELEAEIVEVVAEANSFVEGWGQVIFPTANEMLANEKMRAVFERTNEVKAEIEDKFELRSKSSASQALPSAATTKPGNALSPPQQGTESIVSSDGEGSSKPGKKIKKRK
ncbi:uncharacterized protein LACBIDRAFT_305922 [Laccaria bicolor S238N-H82]|uniref:Predicted protein n=1 Tax=Laccaria bicolor (strain S238N-H82 / ATCC MYA-4686) TaxID=486041 RepID=B0CS92_LACBS|nr:uncharacterized protein LACBIDRAFT_305922 [Laccaria bicolor S238N-H82]EDR14806.1 predicted protein [Laccaria bicolor S238N-H82]|eukprot:XP_001875365.1 predicted protein [Laccaria bicolor S238N-H82]